MYIKHGETLRHSIAIVLEVVTMAIISKPMFVATMAIISLSLK